MEILIPLLFGLVVGSFLNVCIYRIPRNLSIVKPFSFCPNCRENIKPWHNIPVLSYIILKGKCAHCGSKISLRYPIVEALNGILWVFAYKKFGVTIELPFVLFFISALIVITFIDMDFHIIPDSLSLSLIVLGTVLSLIPHNSAELNSKITDSLLGILIGGGILYLIAIVSRGGMGGGDIKLNAGVGAYLGWQCSLLTLFVGSFVGAIVGIVILKKTGNRKIPFGPFLSLGALVSLFFGKEIIKLYLG